MINDYTRPIINNNILKYPFSFGRSLLYQCIIIVSWVFLVVSFFMRRNMNVNIDGL